MTPDYKQLVEAMVASGINVEFNDGRTEPVFSTTSTFLLVPMREEPSDFDGIAVEFSMITAVSESTDINNADVYESIRLSRAKLLELCDSIEPNGWFSLKWVKGYALDEEKPQHIWRDTFTANYIYTDPDALRPFDSVNLLIRDFPNEEKN